MNPLFSLLSPFWPLSFFLRAYLCLSSSYMGIPFEFLPSLPSLLSPSLCVFHASSDCFSNSSMSFRPSLVSSSHHSIPSSNPFLLSVFPLSISALLRAVYVLRFRLSALFFPVVPFLHISSSSAVSWLCTFGTLDCSSFSFVRYVYIASFRRVVLSVLFSS